MGFHLMLAVQKALQGKHGTKGNTVFIFDNENREEKKFANLIASPPAWSDAYYKKGKKQRRLDQIVDVPYFGDSKEVSLIQLADFLAYFLRRYIEIREEAVPLRYAGEDEKTWTDAIKKRLISLSSTLSTVVAKFQICFFKLAPQSALLMPGS